MADNDWWDEYDGEIFLYYGDISRHGYDEISLAYEQAKEKKEKVCLVLITCGGDPDAAYRIARATNHHFNRVEILIPDRCKSAGTLLCIGAHQLIFGDRGELGPLDIQLSKPNEMFESMSGLDIIQAINALQAQLLDSFRTYLVDIRAGSQIQTKMAAEIATKLADGLIAPIASKIDPLTLGEHQRAMQIAFDYGERLNKMVSSLKNNALIKLVSSYPSHGFVIDRKEAGNLFKNVVAPEMLTNDIYLWTREIVEKVPYPTSPLVINIRKHMLEEAQNKKQELKNEKDNADDGQVNEQRQNSDKESKRNSKKNESDIGQPDKPESGTGNTRGKNTDKEPKQNVGRSQ